MWKKLYLAQDIILAHLRVYCPIRTGRLVATITPDNNSLVITIGDENVQYAPYTNESWDNFASPLKGHKNPNEGWINKALDAALPIVDKFLAGSVTEEEAREIVKANNSIWQAKFAKRAKKFREEARTI
jgi:hypothetical protein